MTGSRAVRPTGNRLLVAMGIATASVAALLGALGVLIDLAARTDKSQPDLREPLAVFIRKDAGTSIAAVAPESRAAPPEFAEETAAPVPVKLAPELLAAEPRPSPTDTQLVKDWRAIITETAIAMVDEKATLQEKQASTRQRSRSIMFEPDGAMVPGEEEPVIPDFRFRPDVHVVGLGVTIGSCFIGIPLAGVPVEQRTVAISVFVCAPDS